MANNIWKKGLVLGVIFLFFWVGVLPSVNGKLVAPNTVDNNLHNSAATEILIFIALIKDKVQLDGQLYRFTIIMGFDIQFCTGYGYLGTETFRNYELVFYCDRKIGIFGNHIICAIFFEPVPDTTASI